MVYIWIYMDMVISVVMYWLLCSRSGLIFTVSTDLWSTITVQAKYSTAKTAWHWFKPCSKCNMLCPVGISGNMYIKMCMYSS